MHQRVLLVLNPVSSVELQGLRNLIQRLSFGSKVIVTNEILSTLKNNGIEQIYKVTYPSSEEALQIFSYSAFGQSSPPEVLDLQRRSKSEQGSSSTDSGGVVLSLRCSYGSGKRRRRSGVRAPGLRTPVGYRRSFSAPPFQRLAVTIAEAEG
ncbi:PREDICTED: probable disease resistance protein RPP1 [Camelina sativa]|uniref:Probable disease resistance protein RPP1 n=1 Tax=Camelina sativa TaxID=90675 RepID=A0ABM0VC65_CAMSA|nr:PREDICTED: probable disease resistance protein RPP1 [Camelina sativa]